MAHGEAGGSEDADARCSNVGRQFYATTVNCAGLIWLMDGVEHGLVDGHELAIDMLTPAQTFQGFSQ